MKKKLIVWGILIVFISLTILNFNVVEASDVNPGTEETITISSTSSEVEAGKTIQLTATSSEGTTITWTSSDNSIATVDSNGLVSGIKEGTAVITAQESEKTATCTITVIANSSTAEEENPNIEWTDFTNAKFELKKYGTSQAIVEISNVSAKSESNYYLFITSNSNEPDATSASTEKINLDYDSDNQVLKPIATDQVAKYVELNQDLYVSVLEIEPNGNEKIVTYGNKLERFAEPKYTDAFHATFMTDESDQIVTTFTHSNENDRKLQIKIGKITDTSILQKIKNQDSSGFSNLLSFARNSEGMYDEILDVDGLYNIEYSSNSYTQKPAIELSGLQDEAYYFLYVKADDEYGKYIEQEAVTLAQADVFSDAWFLFFYGSDDFKWADFNDVNVDSGTNNIVDNTIAPGKIPQTGLHVILATSIVAFTGVGIFSYIQYRKNNF